MMAARVGLEPVPRPLRRDAELNLERILVAAQDVFAESGYEASMERIAQRDGVGVGTLYRRFPNKESLVVAIMEMAGQRSLELVSEVLENASASRRHLRVLAPLCRSSRQPASPGLPVTPLGGDPPGHGRAVWLGRSLASSPTQKPWIPSGPM